jgi:hypothetical protein
MVGDYPGDGLPKPIAFPDPESIDNSTIDGIPYITLPTLIELKLTSGMTAPHRIQDLADVTKLISANSLAEDYAGELNPYVADKYRELWKLAQVDDDY